MSEDLVVYQELPPDVQMAEGAKAANALMDVVRKAKLAKKFGGEKEHLYYEAWQALARMNGSTVSTGEAEPVDIDGIKGAKAVAEVINRDGIVIGGAEGYCMRDEPNWKNKPWFQLASMAQTRAGSKALRNLYAWVAVLGGYAATPAEEMEGVHDAPSPAKETPKEPAKTGKITDAQRKRFYAIAKSGGWSDDAIKAYMKNVLGVESSHDIPLDRYEEACSWGKNDAHTD